MAISHLHKTLIVVACAFLFFLFAVPVLSSPALTDSIYFPTPDDSTYAPEDLEEINNDVDLNQEGVTTELLADSNDVDPCKANNLFPHRVWCGGPEVPSTVPPHFARVLNCARSNFSYLINHFLG